MKLKEYFRLGRIFNAEILGLILILSYLLTAKIYDKSINIAILVGLFLVGVLAHIWGGYNNDRLDLSIDSKSDYCKHKPLVTGIISLKNAKIIEFSILFIFLAILLFISPNKIYTAIYILIAIILAYSYNRYNKSNMIINVFGQIYATFMVLVGMSLIVNFNYIIFLSAIVMGLNGIYLNIIEADLKDIRGDIINVPKSLGVKFKENSASNITKFYFLNEAIKISMFLLILYILYLENVALLVFIIAFVFFIINFFVRIVMFKNLSPNREKMKPYWAVQELTSILMISTIYIIVHPFLPLIVVSFVFIWLLVWNKILWGNYLRPQV